MQYADYSGGRPTGAQLKAAGFGGVIRYIGLGGEGKQLIASEYRDLVAVFGAQNVLLVAEAGTGDAWGTDTDDDYARGVAYGRIAVADARAQGVPDWLPLGCAADAHAQAFQLDDVVRYARGFEAAVGKARCGFYGFSETLSAVHNAGIGSWYWRCGSEPTLSEKQWVNFWQRNTAPTVRTVAGVICDINEVYHPILQGDDMTPQEFLDTKVSWWDGHSVPMKDLLAEVYIAARGLNAKPAFDGQTAVVQIPPLARLLDNDAAQTASLAALAAATKDPAITIDAMRQVVNDAVAQRIQITGEVHIGPAEVAQ